MNVSACLDLIMVRLGNRTSPTLRANLLKEMIRIQADELEKMEELPWFIISEEAEAQTEVGEPRLPLPPDFLREVEDDNLYLVQDGVKTEIYKRGYDEARVEIPDNAEAGVPQLYYIRGNYIVLKPTPDAIYTIQYPSYYARQAPPTDSTSSENQWFKHASTLMIGKTGVIAASLHVKDPEAAAYFGGEQERAMIRLVNEITARDEANRSRRMG